jgi:cyclic beta-1,2-glucan synthetase
MVTAAGGGFTRFGDVAVNRWRNDGTTDDYGQWLYLKDVRSGRVWSAGHQPVCARADSYRAFLGNEAVTISRRDGHLETLTSIVVASESRTEARRVVVTNSSEEMATIELTSYQEIVIAPHVSDRGHRAFSNLFVQTEWHPELESIIAMRRPRSAVDSPAWCGHTISVSDGLKGAVSCETDRSLFVGRGRTSRNPVAMDIQGSLSCTVGAVLDPVLALRVTLEIEPGGSVEAVFTTYLAKDRDEAERLAASYHSADEARRLFDGVSAKSERLIAGMGISSTLASAFQDLAGTLLYGIRPSGAAACKPGGEPTRDDLIGLGITAEWPIVLATIESVSGIARLEELLRLHGYWRLKGLACELVIVCGEKAGALAEKIRLLVDGSEEERLNRPRGVWVFRRDALSQRQNDLIESMARIRVDCDKESAGKSIDG